MLNILKSTIKLPAKTISFFRGVIVEMKRTEFPTFKGSIKTAGIVILSTIVVSGGLFLIDTLFVYLRGLLINQS